MRGCRRSALCAVLPAEYIRAQLDVTGHQLARHQTHAVHGLIVRTRLAIIPPSEWLANMMGRSVAFSNCGIYVSGCGSETPQCQFGYQDFNVLCQQPALLPASGQVATSYPKKCFRGWWQRGRDSCM
ncbi:hypothetical protein VFPPC_17355 [Pochonia chlamydosporia 170]|uniref:Uncharacterized protein n=1 Tax=Pochonia chlamydosporia 170 TaxID=1380566 RepID=A0A219ARS9_METCM|nr:hypothetical protein VFPPC_17355 [Pochonia chlamydosporia 170]OWT43496.1 hypothetical protein VFPPC_17355 [Pochonia chlamydosporia 170]